MVIAALPTVVILMLLMGSKQGSERSLLAIDFDVAQISAFSSEERSMLEFRFT